MRYYFALGCIKEMNCKTFRWIFAGVLALFSIHGCGDSGTTDETDTSPPITDTSPPIEDLCGTFCDLIANQCTGDLVIDFGGGDCASVCPLFPPGSPGNTSGDTIYCRVHYLQDSGIDSAVACAVATPAGGNLEVGFLCGSDQPSGGCTSSADLAILENADPFAVGDECYHTCKDETAPEDCARQCIIEGAGFSESCAACAVNATVCTQFQCETECEAGPNSAECVQCRDTSGCNSAFESCSGIGGPNPDECGNAQCDRGETAETCPEDCDPAPETCGNNTCDEGETMDNCPMDCDPSVEKCGNGTCDEDETIDNCPMDCDEGSKQCGNKTCDEDETIESCPKDCDPSLKNCGNGECADGETDLTCPEDCDAQVAECGNGECDEGETDETCPEDCASEAVCGNGECEETETDVNCAEDCSGQTAVCGNGECDEGETDETCPQDCDAPDAVCGNGTCDQGETDEECPEDCEAPEKNCGNGTCDDCTN